MRHIITSSFICAVFLVFTANVFGEACGTGAEAGTRNGIYYTDCFPWQSGDGYIPGTGSTVKDDTKRIRRAINSPDLFGDAAHDSGWGIVTGNPVRGYRRVIFNEKSYNITEEIRLAQFLILEGTSTNTTTGGPTTFITQTAASKTIFLVRPGLVSPPEQEGYDADPAPILEEIAIRDIGFNGGEPSEDSSGIRGEGTIGVNQPALFFQFSNLRFSGFHRAISVDPSDQAWQMDSVRLDRCTFDGNVIGVHVNSSNSGWTITGINVKVPLKATSDEWAGLDTIGLFFESSTYTSVIMATGNGPEGLGCNNDKANVFIKIVRHGNISIQNAVSEGFVWDLVIDGVDSSTKNFPIALINNHFMQGVSIDDSTVLSTGNQFGYKDTNVDNVAKAEVSGYSQIYSIADKFCFQGQTCVNVNCTPSNYSDDTDYSKYHMVGDNARLVSIGGGNGALSFIREGSLFDISEIGGALTVDANYAPVIVKNGQFKFDNGTITLGSLNFGNINAGITADGTLYYCYDCQPTNPCTGSGSGAIAKKINSTWVCN